MKEIILPFSIGLTLFLFGLHMMRIGLEKVAGNHLQDWLLRFTNTPTKGFITGILTTALLQSSSAVTVITISFVDVGILTFSQSIGIILGTNIGTTITTQIMALKIEDFTAPMILLGVLIRLLPLKQWAHLGSVIAGFGCIFLGMETLQWLSGPLEKLGIIDQLIEGNQYPLLTGLLIGTLFTALVQSGSATIALTMSLLAAHTISLPIAIAIVFGSNIGTCVTAWIAAISMKQSARQVAMAHLVLNVVGVLCFMPLIPLIDEAAYWLASEPIQQIAHIQTLFNIICSIVVLPFSTLFANAITWLLPNQTEIIPWKKQY
ncbi:phosphate:Na+ symporter [Seinonella peptonophila]|uniref:Phosphate:Na+ symporter n=1 Tax=Seinonella peptonophila TaxID=112248 RepID=A0A1M4V803_9BACL|nr:Na/Pi symporter [Seinonella peptonophila]SHE65111.1 phosphate:Na+ symporter [Seinonella peptonophila]